MHSHWQKQDSTPLFPNLVWSRPETKSTAGRLLIIGGTGQGFAGTAEAYQAAEKAGIGSVRVILPRSLEKTVGRLFPGAEFVPATPSGSFAVSALAELLDASSWAEGVLIAADTGNNSETTQLFETFLGHHPKPSTHHPKPSPLQSEPPLSHPEFISGSPGQPTEMLKQVQHDDFMVTLCGDVIDSFIANPSAILDRPNTTLVLTMDQLQKLAVAARHHEAFTSGMGLLLLVERLLEFNKLHPTHLIVTYENTVAVASDGRISTTDRADQPDTNTLAAHAATWWLQTPADPYAALTTSLINS